MSKKCDYYIEKNNKDYCALKREKNIEDAEIGRETYMEYCRRDEMKKCPLYMFYEKNK